MFNFWCQVLYLQLTVLVFIQSIRTGDLHLYVDSLSKLVQWFFAFYHCNYALWILIHICDMMTLPKLHPIVYKQCLKGYFAVKKSMHAFSRIAIDEAHEQNNDVVKNDSGAVRLNKNTSALQRWMVSGPEMVRLINDFKTSVDQTFGPQDEWHHKQRPAKQRAFLKDVVSNERRLR